MVFLCKEKERNIYVQLHHLQVQMRTSIYYLSAVSIKHGLQIADHARTTDWV